MADPLPRAFRPEQVAERWSVSRRHVYGLVQSGQLGHIRVGTLIRIRQADIEAYEARQWHAPSSTSPDTGSSPAQVVTMSGGGRRAGTAFQRGQAIAAKLNGSSPQFIAGTLEPPPPAIPTVGAILDGYLADRKPMVASYATLEYACAALRRHLGDLTPEHLTVARSRLYARQRRAEGHMVGPADAKRRKPTSDGTIAREVVTLRSALRWAERQRWIASAPYIEAPSAPPPRDRWLTRDEAQRLLNACQMPHVRLFVALGLYTAARAGALLDLTWDRVDLVRGVIDLGSGTGNKRRNPVPVADALRPYLLEARAGATTDYVIEHGSKAVGSIKTGFNAACRRAGLEAVTPHILRHTAATWMVEAGVPVAEVARFLGNTEKMIEKVYGKHSPNYLRGAARALTGSLAPKTPDASVG